jgi:hypothetical protein
MRRDTSSNVVSALVAAMIGFSGASPADAAGADPCDNVPAEGAKGKTTIIAHDSIVFESLEPAAQRYFVRNGRLLKSQLSD